MEEKEAIQAYPLTWPAGWHRCRTVDRRRARFAQEKKWQENGQPRRSVSDLNVADGLTRVLDQLDLMGIPRLTIVISSNVPSKRNGMPYSQRQNPVDPGVAVYWQAKAGRRCIAVDRYDRVADNLAAIAATLEAMRAIKRHGGAEILERAFTGFKQLMAPEQWWQVLGLAGEEATEEQIEAAWREMAKKHHPDVGGNHNEMARINDARDRGLAFVRSRY